MKRLGLLLAIAGIAAGGVYYASRHAQSTPHAGVTTLLPAGTVVFAHMPDFQRTRAEWKESDLYKLYHEPAVQDFLKPLSNVPQQDATAQNLSDLERLDPKDAFLAVTSVENNSPHFVGGFRFNLNQSDAEQIVGKWRARLVRDSSAHETIDYEQHKIDIAGAAPNQIATVYDKQWFFVSNDLAELKTTLDRADGRANAPQNTLEGNEIFRAAIAHMPPSYSLLFYIVPGKLSASIRNQVTTNAGDNARAALEQFQSICGVGRFEKGKIRDVFFLGAAKSSATAELTRNSIKLGSADTFLYVAALLNPDRLTGIDQASGGLPLGSWWQKLFDVASRSGLTIEDWKAAFDLEASALADWPQTAHLPSIVTLLPVKDPARAFKVAEVLTKAFDEDATWRKTEKDGVRYYYMQSPVSLFTLAPTIAVSNQQMIIGLDSVSVEAAMTRSQSSPKSTTPLSDSSTYKTASRALPAPTTAFVYIDTALLYSRLDAALRPMLLMSAAFMPAIGEYVDVTKLPPSEVVTRHLTPIVLSQRYERDGYVTESTGPISLEAGLALPALGWALNLEKNKP